MTIIQKRKKKTKIADKFFRGKLSDNKLPNFSQIGSGAADMELETYS